MSHENEVAGHLSKKVPGQKKNETKQEATSVGADRDPRPTGKAIASADSPLESWDRSSAGGEPDLPEALILEAISGFSAYLRSERKRYRPQGRSLRREALTLFGRFFSQELLGQIRVVPLSGSRLANPSFYKEAGWPEAINLPHLPHEASMTFLDVVVFNERITDRQLFHALVQSVQVRVLGPRRYANLFVRGLLRARSYTLAPMKAHAFVLDTRFTANPDRPFSVEEEVRKWLNEGRY